MCGQAFVQPHCPFLVLNRPPGTSSGLGPTGPLPSARKSSSFQLSHLHLWLCPSCKGTPQTLATNRALQWVFASILCTPEAHVPVTPPWFTPTEGLQTHVSFGADPREEWKLRKLKLTLSLLLLNTPQPQIHNNTPKRSCHMCVTELSQQWEVTKVIQMYKTPRKPMLCVCVPGGQEAAAILCSLQECEPSLNL